MSLSLQFCHRLNGLAKRLASLSSLGVWGPTLVLGLGLSSAGAAESASIYLQPSAPVEARVEDLLARMTPKEKIAQISSWWEDVPDAKVTDEDLATRYAAGAGTYTVRKRWQLSLEDDIAFRNRIRRILKEKTRLGIPAFFHEEAAHGYMKPEATSFPAPIGLACTWDEALIERLYDMAAREARSRGADQILAPVVDVTLDPRWGRTEETLGEDPFLNGRLGTAIVKGLQGGATGEIDGDHVAATLKHLSGHGVPEGGVNQSPGHMGPFELRETHVAPFAAIIRAAHPAAIMPSYTAVDGIPSHSNRALLLDLVRGEYGFTGLYISDYTGVSQLYDKHFVAPTKAAAARLALESGVQMELPLPETFSELEPLIGKDAAVTALVDNAVRAVLRAKFKLGLFDEPVALDTAKARAIADRPESRELALQAARESIVLLKNEGGLLPLSIGRYKRIAVIGPNADVVRLGGYSGTPKHSVSLLAGVRDWVGNKAVVVYAEGCRITGNDTKNSFQNWYQRGTMPPDSAENRRLIAEAKAVADQSDVIILAVGENEAISRESGTSKPGDRASLDLFGDQAELAEAMIATGKPVVLFLTNGRPIALHSLGERIGAIVEGWFAGQETGRAAAEILFGETNPSGKLTISFPRSVGHIPAQYRHLPSYGENPYVFDSVRAVYAFGHGLSYTTFEYKNPKVSKAQVAVGESVQVTVELTNTGKRAGTEVAQLYVRDETSSVERPVMELRGFQRVSLQSGETKTVTFELTSDSLAFYNRELKRVVEPGWFTVMVGGSSAETKQARFEVR